MTRRSLESSGLRNGEQTACQTADCTPEPGREADLGQVGVVDVAAESTQIVDGASPRRPAPTSVSRSHMRRNESCHAGQCSRSSSWRSFSASFLTALPQAPSATTSLQASSQCIAGPMNSGSDVPISRCSTSPEACSLDPAPLVGVDHRAVARVEHAPGARVDHHHARRADVAAEAPARPLRPPRRPAWRTRAAAASGPRPVRRCS